MTRAAPRRLASARAVAKLVAVAAAGSALDASAQSTQLSFRTGFEYASGDYGGAEDVADLYVPFTIQYETRRLAFRATVPYLEVEFTAPIDGSSATERGLGDAVLGLTVYDVFRSSDGSVVVDVTGKVKLGTADEQLGLGTGETDYAVEADIYKFLGRGTFVASAGYKIRGEPADVLVEDTWFISVGGFRHFSTFTSVALFMDHRQSAVPGLEPIRELTASLARRLDGPWRIQGYVVRGFSDTSLDWGAGLSIRRDL